MKNSRIICCPCICDRVDRRGKTFIGEILGFQKNREAFSGTISDLEPEERVGVGVKRVGLVNGVMREIPLQVGTEVKARRSGKQQFGFVEMLRDSRDTVIAINGIIIEVEIVQRVGLA